MVIDAHIHIFPDKLAPKALKNLSEICKSPYYADGTAEGTRQSLKSWGIDAGICMNIATKPKQQSSVNQFAASVQGGGLFCFGSVHPDAPDALDELRRIKELGLYGVKLHPDYQEFMVDDKRLFPIYEALSELELPVTFHTGWDPYSPGLIHAPSQAVARVAELFPRMTVIAAHMGGLNRYAEAEEYLAGKENVYLDTALSCRNCSPEQMLRLIRRHGAERVLFASDCPWSRSSDELDFLEKIPLTSSERDAVYYQNAKRLLNLPL